MTTEVQELYRSVAAQYGEEIREIEIASDGRLRVVTKSDLHLTFTPSATLQLCQYLIDKLRLTVTLHGQQANVTVRPK
jgi:hypothetical protein